MIFVKICISFLLDHKVFGISFEHTKNILKSYYIKINFYLYKYHMKDKIFSRNTTISLKYNNLMVKFVWLINYIKINKLEIYDD